MKTFRIICLIALLSAAISSVAQQKSRLDSSSIQRGGDSIETFLNLTNEQAQTFKSINKSFLDSSNKLNQVLAADDPKGQRRKDLFTWRENQLKKLFTVEQYQKYKATGDARRQEYQQKVKELKDKQKMGG